MAFALLTHTAKGATASNTVTTTAIDTTGATILVLALSGDVQFVPSALTDSAGNTNYINIPTKSSGGDDVTLIFMINPVTSTTHTFTFTQTSSFPSLAVAAFSGTVAGIQSWTAGSSSSSTTVQPGSLTPNGANALLVTAYSNTLSSGTPTFSIDSAFTKTDQIAGGSNPTAVALAYLIQTTAAAVNPTWTSTTSTSNIAQMVAINLVASGGSGGTTGFASA